MRESKQERSARTYLLTSFNYMTAPNFRKCRGRTSPNQNSPLRKLRRKLRTMAVENEKQLRALGILESQLSSTNKNKYAVPTVRLRSSAAVGYSNACILFASI
jgi:hypothetical protein